MVLGALIKIKVLANHEPETEEQRELREKKNSTK
jgi:hypothetical protein